MLLLKHLKLLQINVSYLANLGCKGVCGDLILCKRHAFKFKQITSDRLRFFNSCNWNLLQNDTINACDKRKFSLDKSRNLNKSDVFSEKSKLKKPFLQRIFVQKYEYDTMELKKSGFNIYEKCTDGVNFESFIRICKMPDTYYSWFLVTELHVWMSLVRVMAEGEEGKFVRNSIIEALWKDASVRAKKVGVGTISVRQKTMQELNGQFITALFLYDEGLQSGDAVLAGALWYRFLERKCNDAAVLAQLVHYVRKQIFNLEKASRADVIRDGNISFSPISDLKRSVIF